MKDSSTLADLSKKVNEFCDIRDWRQFHSPKDLAVAISIEAAELMELFRYKSEDDVKRIMADPAKREAIRDELGDLMFLLLRFGYMHGFYLDEALENKIVKIDEKYPLDVSRGRNMKYYEY